jgi:hypothetical protein
MCGESGASVHAREVEGGANNDKHNKAQKYTNRPIIKKKKGAHIEE